MAQQNLVSDGDSEQDETLLESCPICGEGRLRNSPEQRHLYRCTTCDSSVEEGLLGFSFKALDARFEKRAKTVQGQTYTKPELLALAGSARRRPSPLAGAKAKAPATAKQAEQLTEELLWELDE